LRPRLKTIIALAIMALAIYPSMRLVTPRGDAQAVQATTGLGQLWGSSDRRTADGLLRRARKALDENNLELADWYLQRVEKLNVDYTAAIKGKDTPKQLRMELEQRRADQRLNGTSPSPLPSDGSTAEAATPSERFQPESVSSMIPPRSPAPAAAPLPQGADKDLNAMADQLLGNASLPDSLPAAAEYAAAPADYATTPYAALPTALAPTTVAQPQRSGDLSSQKAQALGLVAMARAALDRGDAVRAEQYAKQAQAMGLPDEVFAPGETHPDIVVMEVARLKSRLASGGTSAPAATARVNYNAPANAAVGSAGAGVPGAMPVPPYMSAPDEDVLDPLEELTPGAPTQPTGGLVTSLPGTRTYPAAAAVPVPSQAARIPDTIPPDVSVSPPTQNPGGATPAQILMPLESFDRTAQAPVIPQTPDPTLLTPPAAPDGNPYADDPLPTGSAQQFYEDGMAALRQHDVAEARRLFKQAWGMRDQLDPATVQQLQDQLQSLSGPPTAPNEAELAMEEPADALQAADQEEIRKILEDVTREQAAIRRLREERPTEAWERSKKLRETIAQANISTDAQQRLLARVDRGTQELEAYIAENKSLIELDERNRSLLEEIERNREQRIRTQQQLAEMVDNFNKLIDEQRYAEASVVAKKARELDPQNPVVENLVWKAQVAREISTNLYRTERFQQNSLATLGDVDESGVPFPDSVVTQFPRNWEEMSRNRLRRADAQQSRYSEAELQIQQALKKPVDVNFENEPLASALDQLGRMAGINIYLDPEGMNAERVSTDTTVTLPLRKPVSLKSALNLILQPLRLSYVIQDEVLRITSEQVRDGDIYPVTYYVADLVLPIPNFAPSYNMGLPGAIRDGFNTAGYASPAGTVTNSPFTVPATYHGTSTSPASTVNPVAMAQVSPTGSVTPAMGANGMPYGYGPGGPGGGTQADFETLIELIEKTVEPDTWQAAGGTGDMEGFPTNLSLVVSQTQEVHEKIADLLEQLRRLQDLQVTIEVRFITLSDDFFERIGVDFDFDVDDNTGLLQGEITPLDDDGPSVTIGLDPVTRAPRADLDIGITQGSFGSTTPVFGGYTPNAAANVGFAILSDIEAFFVIEAVQGDSRTNILQAPKVTLFNGQQAFVSDTSQRPFVTSVIPVVGDFAAAHQPVITVLTEGTSLSVQAVVSQDRRFVRLTLVPFFSRIGDVDTFTFNGRTDSDSGTTSVDPTDDTNTVNENVRTITQGTTVQLPTFAFTTVNTTVSVPDGGTILLGGIKRLSEGRNEQGVPLLSKLPYVNRLFKNVGIGRETSSLMMMVTPRIIIQEEEEELQTGYRSE
jgi:general secretion pathway protein D